MPLFSPLDLGDIALPNRIVMAPLGRARNHPVQREPWGLSQVYYAQRASAGLIISEATHISAGSVSRPGTGAVHTTGQIAAWRAVTDAVHEAGGRIFQQLFHLGRKADPKLRPGRLLPIAPRRSPRWAVSATRKAMTSTFPFLAPSCPMKSRSCAANLPARSATALRPNLTGWSSMPPTAF